MTDGRPTVPTVEGRCTACWGNARHPECEGGEVTRIECTLCTNHVVGKEAAVEWREIESESRRNLTRTSRGEPAKYRSDAKFVRKIIPDLPRDKAGMDRRIQVALKSPREKGRARWLTRHNVPAGEAGFLYLQAKLLAAGLRSFPQETAINRWDEMEITRPVGLRIDGSAETGIHVRADAEGVSRTAPGTFEERAGALMMRALTAAFSCEVALKAILMTRNDRARMTHDLRTLYCDLPGDSRARLKGDYAAIADVLKESGEIFGKSRYFENSASLKEVAERGLHHERIRDLERAARVIIDECAMVGLEGELGLRAHAALTRRLGQQPEVTDYRESMSFSAESGESAIAWPKLCAATRP